MVAGLKDHLEQMKQLTTRLVKSLQADASSGDLSAASNLALAELLADKVDQLSDSMIDHDRATGSDQSNQGV